MGRYIVDAETNGLLHELDVVHCIVLKNIDTGDILSCADQPGYPSIERALDYLSEATEIIGHNVINFDLRALNKVYPSLALDVNCGIYDTLNMSRLLWPELEPVDRAKFSHIDSKFIGRHSLAAWGERLGVAKIKFKEESKKITENVWAHWSQSMSVYCEGDVAVTHELYNYLLTQEVDPRSVELEHEFAKVMAMQESFGFPFNEKAAFALVNTLKAERSELDEQLQEVFLPVVENRVSAKTGKPLKSKVTVFNPASRQQTAERLQACYPEIVFNSTEKGNVKVDDDVLELLGEKYPEAKILARYQLLNKRIAQIADGKEAWLKHCQLYGDGRIHGSVVTNACISGRCSHKRPNMAQIPSVGHAYGSECRSLFYAPEGWVLVGADASGLELRALGAMLAHFDGGDYARLVSNPDRDVHFHNACLFGIHSADLPIDKTTRDLSKRLIYCILYGGGAKKTGSIVVPNESEHTQYEIGKKTIDTFYKNLPAIKQLKDLIDKRITERGYLVGIDGRKLQIRSRHSALNQLLQSTGAVLMKKATCILYNDLEMRGLKHNEDWGFCVFCHDEWQILTRPQHADIVAAVSVKAIEKAAKYFNLKCPFTGEYRIGQNWQETH
jgi:DNA polymerase I-like protein with 3'-5' exonuclease and polymerase domains